MWDDSMNQDDEMEMMSFGYFFLGVLLPGFWGYLFMSYALDPAHYNLRTEECGLLVNWAMVAGGVFLIHASFYMIMSTFACLGGARSSWYPKYLKFAHFEDNFWRSFVLTFSLLGIFGILGVLNKEYEQQFLACGELFKLTQMFYYIFFSILASFAIIACLIQCSLETESLEENEAERANREERRRERRRQRREQRQQSNNIQAGESHQDQSFEDPSGFDIEEVQGHIIERNSDDLDINHYQQQYE